MTRIDGLHNFRDTGGLPLAGGGESRRGVLFRSAALNGLTASGLEQLAATGIGVVVDFRTPHERLMAPNRLPASRPFEAIELSLLEGAMRQLAQQLLRRDARPTPEQVAVAAASLPTLGNLYLGMLRHGAETFATLARLIAASRDDAPTAVLVHCTAGKDRTGIATALMLDAVGVEREAVVADYASSQDQLAGAWADAMVASVSAMGMPITPAMRTLLVGTPPTAIEQALAWTDAEHGGSAGYLMSAGLIEPELDGLRLRLAG